MRWLKELFKPRLKCKRLGHKLIKRKLIIRKFGNEPRIIVEDFSAYENHCLRCRKIGTPIVIVKVNWFNSVSMPDHMWDELRIKGFLRMRYLQ